jgi:hypothetical protein
MHWPIRYLARLAFAASLLTCLCAQPLPVAAMKMADPEQLARGLRELKPLIAAEDCHALDLWECTPDEPRRSTDVSVRWIQLDDDPELEVILVTEAKAEWGYAAYVFDKRSAWNLVGKFFDRRGMDRENLVRVQKLTEDSPMLVLVTRDLGGSGSSLFTTEAFQLREGKLWPVLQIMDSEVELGSIMVQRQRVFATPNRLIVHSIHEEPKGRVQDSNCEVLRWDRVKHGFLPATNEHGRYCNPKTGRPLAGKATRVELPSYRY